jgi:hypothetical protein
MKTRLVQAGMLAALSFAAIAPYSALRAQGTQAAPEQVQLAFGYQCDDKFLLRNDGTQPVTVEYGIAGAEQRASLDLRGRETVELTSTAATPLELWMNGKIIATEEKGNRSCAASQGGGVIYEQASPVVVVRPIIEADYVGYAQAAYYSPRVVVVSAFPQYGYRSAPVDVAPLVRGYGTYGRDVRVTQGGQVGRVDYYGGGRPTPSHVEPRRSAPQSFNDGRGRQMQGGGGARERPSQQYATSGHSRPAQQQGSGGHTRQAQGDRGRSHHR